MNKKLSSLLAATAFVCITAHGHAMAQNVAPSASATEPRPVSQYMAVTWENNGYLVTENWGKSWRLVSSDAVSELPDRLVALLRANIAGKEAASAAVIPNPTVGPIALRFSAQHSGNVRITIHDTQGAERLRVSRDVQAGFQTQNIDLSSLPTGAYYYRIVNEGGSIGSGAVTVVR